MQVICIIYNHHMIHESGDFKKYLTFIYKTERLYHIQNLKESIMFPKNTKLITCNALASSLLPLIESRAEVKIMDIGLHLNPNRLRDSIQGEIEKMEEEGVTLLLGYGLCGRGLEGVCSNKSTLILPRVDDCVGALLGSRDRHREILKKQSGSFFLEPSWLDTEMNIFVQLPKELEHYTAERQNRIISMALKHYTKLSMLVSGEPDPIAVQRCEKYAQNFSLDLKQVSTDLALLSRLIKGPWNRSDFVIALPGEPIPFF